MEKHSHNHPYQALYRKYRPKNFSEVRGQDHIINALLGSLSKNSIGHAYLFFGTRGLGKTTIARLLAKELKCQPEDIYEIDGASNRKIEDIRELRDAITTLPLSSPYKIYIIDEVHMLTNQAFNALLKTLEEPPSHVIFILATTELNKVPDTIISRCQVFTFRKPSQNLLKEAINDVANKEGYTLDNEAQEIIALEGDGSYRDALSVLEKILSASKEKKINGNLVSTLTGTPKNSLIKDIIQSIIDSNPSLGLTAIQTASENNYDLSILNKLVIRYMRLVIMLRFNPNSEASLKNNLSEEDYAFVKKASTKAGKNINSNSLSNFLFAQREIKTAFQKEIPIEIALLKSTQPQ